MPPPDAPGCFIVDRLQPQLYCQIGAAGEILQIAEYRGWQTVGPGGYRQPYYAGKRQYRFKGFPQNIHRGIGIRARLKIGDIPRSGPLFFKDRLHLMKL